MSAPLFNPGQIVFTPGALEIFSQKGASFIRCLHRHITGDWGDLSAADKKENDYAVKSGDRILSAYLVNGMKVWIITEGDRSATTLLLPEEY